MFHANYRRIEQFFYFVAKDAFGGVPVEGDTVLVTTKAGVSSEVTLGKLVKTDQWGWWFAKPDPRAIQPRPDFNYEDAYDPDGGF